MSYSSLIFMLYFLPITVGIYYLFRFSQRVQNVWLLIASLIFYAWGSPVHIMFLLASLAVNYGMGFLISRQQETAASAKPVLTVACVFNLVLLFVYHYLTPLAAGVGFAISSIVAPLGIALITMHSIS